MKRIVSLLIIAVLFVSCMVPSAFAAGSATVTVETVTAKPGDTVKVAVSISQATFASYLMEVIEYDKTVLQLTSISAGNVLPNNFESGTVKFASMASKDVTTSGVVAYLTFTVSENAVPGETYPIKLKVHNVVTAAVKDDPTTEENEYKAVEYLDVEVENGGIKIAEPAHVHGNLTKVDYKAPTCVDDGNIEHWKCSCGSLFDAETNGNLLSADDVIIPATGVHSYGEWIIDKDATCGANGSKYRECSVCHTKETETIPATGDHKYGEWVTDEEATCGADGTKHRVCSECQAVEKGTIPATGEHTTGEWAHDPTYHWHVCKNCGKACDDIELHDWKEGDDGYYHCKCGAKGNKIDAGEKDDGKDDVPGTGDITPQITLMVVAVIAVFATAIAFVFKRKTAK